MDHTCEDTILMISNIYFEPADNLCNSTMENNGISIKPIITIDYGLCHQINISQSLKTSGTGMFLTLCTT